MEASTTITHFIEEAIQAAKMVIPLPHSMGEPIRVQPPILQPEMGVLIGITGDIRGRLLLESTSEVFGRIGSGMFGMILEGEMLESFAGELGNMIGGNISTGISARHISMDITPPTVIVGQSKLSGFSQALCIPLKLETSEELKIIFILEENQ